VLLEAVPAVDGASLGGFERYFTFISAIGAHSFEKFFGLVSVVVSKSSVSVGHFYSSLILLVFPISSA
jgi:hypothetical protein